MRLLGAVLLWITFTLIGMRTSLLLKKRQILIEETITFLNSLSVQIEYSRTTIVKIIRQISVEESAKNLQFLKYCCDEIEKGADFPFAWHSAVMSSRLYKIDEKTKLLQLGSFLGASDSENQINTIKVYTHFFEKFLFMATEDYNKYGKASSLFGLFAGAAVFILLF